MPVDVTGSRVLVIDDNAVNREILLEQLRSWGFDCAAAESGAVGLAFLDRAAQLGARGRLRHPRLPDARHERRRRCQGDVRRTRGTTAIPVVLLTSVDQIDFGPHGDRLRHCRASDQAGAIPPHCLGP